MLEDLSDIPEEAASQAELVGEKILAAIDQPFWLSSRECLSTCSIGITVFGDKRENTDEVLQQADIAMYQAKAAGRNTMRFFRPCPAGCRQCPRSTRGRYSPGHQGQPVRTLLSAATR
jgi:predicted signal transduction protein with EAL and GGDEF domain